MEYPDRYSVLPPFVGLQHDERPKLSGARLPDRRVCTGFQADHIPAGAPMLPVGHPGKLRLFKFDGQCDAQMRIVYAAMAYSVGTFVDIDERGFLTAAGMVFQWWFAFFEWSPFLENLRTSGSFARGPGALPANVDVLVHQGPPEVHVVKEHVRCRGIPGVHDFVVDTDNRFTQAA